MKAGTQAGAGISVAVAALIAFASIFAAMSSQSSLQTGTGIGNGEKPEAPRPIAAESKPSAAVQVETPKEEEKPAVMHIARVEEEKAGGLFSGVTPLDYLRIDRGIFVLVNGQREKAGLEPVNWDFDLAAIAGRHSIDMISSGYFNHTDPLGFDVADRYLLEGVTCSFPVTNRNAEGIYKSGQSVLELDEAAIAATAVAGMDVHAIENPDAERLGAGVALDSEGLLYSTVNLC